jgi:hypothetical protein
VSSPTRDDLLQMPIFGPSAIEAEPYNDELSAVLKKYQERLKVGTLKESAKL